MEKKPQRITWGKYSGSTFTAARNPVWNFRFMLALNAKAMP
jgi:hypothetical protein